MVKTTIEFKPDGKGEIQLVSEGLHMALGYIEDVFVRAKEGLNAEVARVIIETIEN